MKLKDQTFMNEKKKTVFYINGDGEVFDSYSIKQAFYITTGLDPEKNEGKYIRFLDSLFGKGIINYKTFSPEELLEMGYKVKAIKLYRDLNDCSLMEAKRAIDEMDPISHV